jgi:hypothetical protein
MQQETGSLMMKSLATAGGASVAFGLTWWAVAAAILGAIASLHFEQPATGSTVKRVLLQILALSLLAALLGSALPFIPGFRWSAEVPVAVRAGLLGLFANPINNAIRFGMRAGIRFFLRKYGEEG